MADASQARSTTALPLAFREKGEAVSAGVTCAADHDTFRGVVKRDPSWSTGKDADKETAARVAFEWFDGEGWQFLCGFATGGDPPRPTKPDGWPKDVPWTEPPEPTESWIVFPLPPQLRGKTVRARLTTEKPSSVDCKIETEFLNQKFDPSIPPRSIGYDAASSAEAGFANQLSWSHAGGTPTGMAIGAACPLGTTVTSVTYDGASCSLVDSISGLYSVTSTLYQKGSPSAGTKTVVVNFSGTTTVSAGAVSVTGGNTTTPLVNMNKAQDSSYAISQLTVNVTSATGDLVFVTGAYTSFGTTTEYTGQTNRWLKSTYMLSRGSTKAGASSVTVGYFAQTEIAIIAANFQQAAASGDMAGSAAFALTTSAALTGSGALSAAAAMAIEAAAAMIGSGALIASASMAIDAAAVMVGLASAQGSAAIEFDAEAAMIAVLGLAGSAAIELDASGSIAGYGGLAAEVAMALATSGALTGSGALSGQAAIALSAAARLLDGTGVNGPFWADVLRAWSAMVQAASAARADQAVRVHAPGPSRGKVS